MYFFVSLQYYENSLQGIPVQLLLLSVLFLFPCVLFIDFFFFFYLNKKVFYLQIWSIFTI